MIATANTLDDWPIFTRVDTAGSMASLISNIAVMMLGFFSTSSSRRLTPGRVVDAPSGTTAPFSAMSGACKATSLLSLGAEAPSAFIRSAMFLASKAAVL